MANNNVTGIDLLALDPDSAKQSLIDFLKQQTTLRSYDYTGSAMNEILSVLGTNTFRLAFYYNMINSESWLDSSQLRSSVVSHAKDLGYTPRSARSAQAIVALEIPTNGTISAISIPKGTTFTGRVGTSTYNFSTSQNKVYTSSTGTFLVDDLDIYEGNYVQDSFVVDYANPVQRFILTNKMMDTDSMTVTVIEDGGSTTIEYQYASSFLGVSQSSTCYFLQCNETENYEVLFGDDLFGRMPQNGSQVIVTYRVSSGDGSNGINQFTLNRDVTGGNLQGQVVVTTRQSSRGGAFPETIESIRFAAPRHYEVQERAVSESDYETLLREEFPEIDAVTVFGGETLNPPQYGKVVVAVDIAGVNGLPNSLRDKYLAYLAPRAAMKPVFIAQDRLYCGVETTVEYDTSKTTLLPADIETIVTSAVATFNVKNLQAFKVTLSYSRLVAAIDAAHESIINNVTDIFVYKKIVPDLGVKLSMTVDLVTPIFNNFPPIPHSHPSTETHSVWSSEFTYKGQTCIVEDDSLGNMWLVTTSGTNDVQVNKVGTVDYSTGVVTFTNLMIDDYVGSYVKLYCIPVTKNVTTRGANVMEIEVDSIVVNAVQVNKG